MNIWDILGIPSTDDEKSIERAYRQKLKGIDRSVDIAGFYRLYDAYEKAVQIARGYELIEIDGNTEIAVKDSQAESQSKSIQAPEGWHEVNNALSHFFSAENITDPRIFVDSYEYLMLFPQLVAHLYRFELVEQFLEDLRIRFQENPILARKEFLKKVSTDFNFDKDIKIYERYAHILHRIEAQCAHQ